MPYKICDCVKCVISYCLKFGLLDKFGFFVFRLSSNQENELFNQDRTVNVLTICNLNLIYKVRTWTDTPNWVIVSKVWFPNSLDPGSKLDNYIKLRQSSSTMLDVSKAGYDGVQRERTTHDLKILRVQIEILIFHLVKL